MRPTPRGRPAESLGSGRHAAHRVDRRRGPQRLRRHARAVHRRDRPGARAVHGKGSAGDAGGVHLRRPRDRARASRLRVADRIASSLSAASGDVAALVGAQAERLKDSETRATQAREGACGVSRRESLFDAAAPNADGRAHHRHSRRDVGRRAARHGAGGVRAAARRRRRRPHQSAVGVARELGGFRRRCRPRLEGSIGEGRRPRRRLAAHRAGQRARRANARRSSSRSWSARSAGRR